MDNATRLAIQKLAKQLNAHGDDISRLKMGAGTAQLGHSSLQGKSINVYDATGQSLMQTVGVQQDGTAAVVNHPGPTPLEPSAPEVFATIAGATATWDGLSDTGDTMLADFDHVEVHASQVSLFLPDGTTKKGTIPRVSGAFPITGLDSGATYYVRLVAVSTSAVHSPPSDQTSVIPLDAPAGSGGGDTVIPGIPDVSGTIPVSAYIDITGDARSTATVSWTAPEENADGSPLDDGNYFEVQYRPTSPAGLSWQSVYEPWENTSATIPQLIPGAEYEFQVRAVDTSGNQGAWSSPVTQVMAVDEEAPGTPSAPTVAASITSIQVLHDLTLAAGVNLPDDMDHLDVHVGTSSGFTTSAATKVGTISATKGMIAAGVDVVATFTVSQTILLYVKVVAVDKSGNASSASAAGSATALLIDSAHISDITASKITAGTLGASLILGGTIATATTGARSVMNSDGFHSFTDDGSETFTVTNGNISIVGELASGPDGSDRVRINPADGTVDLSGNKIPEIRFEPSDDPTNFSRIWSHPGDVSGQATMRIDSGWNTAETALTSYFQSSDYMVLGPVDTTTTGTSIGGRLNINGEYAGLIAADSTGATKSLLLVTKTTGTKVLGLFGDYNYPDWYAMTFANNWGNRGSVISKAKLMPGGYVFVQGELEPKSGGTTGGFLNGKKVAQLPYSVMYPPANVTLPVTLGSGVPYGPQPCIVINSSGEVNAWYCGTTNSTTAPQAIQFSGVFPLI